jgi:hypothetical protein
MWHNKEGLLRGRQASSGRQRRGTGERDLAVRAQRVPSSGGESGPGKKKGNVVVRVRLLLY